MVERNFEGVMEKNGFKTCFCYLHYIFPVPEIRRGTTKFYCNLEAPSKKKKRNFCIFCKKLFTQLPRHLERAHLNEEGVKNILSFPKSKNKRS